MFIYRFPEIPSQVFPEGLKAPEGSESHLYSDGLCETL